DTSASHATDAYMIAVKVAEANRAPKAKRVAFGGTLGDEARLYKVTTRNQGFTFDFYVLAWRSGKILSVVNAGGLAGTVAPQDVVTLARKQQSRVSGRAA